MEEGTRGNDIVLTIDIDLQREIEQILAEELLITKSEPNTDFYNRSFVIVQDAKTGEILAMTGKQIQNVPPSLDRACARGKRAWAEYYRRADSGA